MLADPKEGYLYPFKLKKKIEKIKAMKKAEIEE